MKIKLCECGCKQPTKISKYTDPRRGAVKGQSMRFLHGHYAGVRLGHPPTHGHTIGGRDSVEYHAYIHAKGRCTNPRDAAFHNYGGRGIEFRFESFLEFLTEVGERPSPKHSLDRYPDNNGHYEKGNLRWATRLQQNRNKRPYRKKITRFSDKELLAECARRGWTVSL
jgi:hypothetical protein